jgi:murein L,D-transpeptidase YcbB/YkuD
LLATDAVVRLAYHLRFGKVDVTRIDPRWNFEPDTEEALAASPAHTLAEALDQRRVRETLGALHPASPLYAALRRGLATYQAIRAEGGWKAISPGRPIRPGATDPRVPALRARLAIERDLQSSDEEASALYDSELEIGARRFQERHGLASDGIVGNKTLEALNVPVETRIDQLRVTLEQGRQTLHDLPQRFVLVNVPAFRLYYADETGRRFSANVVVGRRFTQTPIFRSEMTHLVINPSWTVPPGILRRDTLPGLARDPDYLKRKGLVRVGDQYVQPPGPNNAMGRIKLMFPNPYLVYLHDTPQKDLLDADARLFSSGCIRVQNVFDLAELIVDDPTRWSKQQLLRVVESGRTQTVMLKRRVPVLLVYWTAAVSPVDDRVFFYADVYERDAAMRAALDGPFVFSPPIANRAATVSQRP